MIDNLDGLGGLEGPELEVRLQAHKVNPILRRARLQKSTASVALTKLVGLATCI